MSLLIYQGSTPTHQYTIPYPKDAVSEVLITYAQNDKIVVEKTGESVTVSDYAVQTELTQTDTLKFLTQDPVAIQLKIKFTTGKVLPSDILYAPVMEVLNREEL